MNEELSKIESLLKEKAEAKTKVMKSLGAALIKDAKNEDSMADWQVVAEYGTRGVEGEKAKEAVSLADDYVSAHEDEFKIYKDMGLEDCVKVLDAFRASGLDEQVMRVKVWLMHRFEPQNIGGRARAVVRIPGRN